MRFLRLFFRAFGWLLTPFMAWAASFFGCVAGAMLATRIADPITGLLVTAILGGVAGFSGLMAWLRLLRTSPEIREVLAVDEEGTPDLVTPLMDEPPVAAAAQPEPRDAGA
jgi:hypothetical protein